MKKKSNSKPDSIPDYTDNFEKEDEDDLKERLLQGS